VSAPTLEISFASYEALPDRIGNEDRPLVVMPFIDADAARRAAQQIARRAGVSGTLLCVQDGRRAGFIAVANGAFRRSLAPSFAYIAQDAFAGRNWLKFALAELAKNSGGLLALNDGKWGGALAAFGVVDRAWAAQNYGGDLFFPSYKRHYADVELTLIAMQQRKLRFDPLALLVEVDWDKEASKILEEDRLLYYRRGQTAFDRKVTNPGLRRLFK
jgi:hypothetical protein